MKAIILARVSDKKQDSNEAQIGRISDYVRHKGLVVWKTYEIEESSTKGDRERFQEVVKEIRQSKECIALVVDTVDRLQRSFKESVLLDDLRKAGKLEIHFYRENLIINKVSNSADLLRWDMAVMFARSYILQLSDNVKRKFDQKRKNGEWIGRAPIGYQNIGEEKNKRDIIPNQTNAHLVKRVFELYATGNYSFYKVRDIVTLDGLKNEFGKKLAPSMIEFILNNPFYYGYMRSNEILYPHKYPPLVTKDLFDMCQAVKRNWNKKPFQYAAKPFIFRGLIRCGNCGCAMSPERHKKKYVYYSCTNAKKDLCDRKVYVSEETLLKPVYKVLRAFKNIPQSRIDEIIEGLKKSTQSKEIYHKDSIKSLRDEYDGIQVKLQRLTDLLIDGSVPKEVYDLKLQEFKNRQHDINLQIANHTGADENYYITVSALLNIAKNALSLFESSETSEKRAILNFLLQNSTVNGKKLTFTMRSPFDHILKLARQPMGLPPLDTFGTVDWQEIKLKIQLLSSFTNFVL